MPIKQDKLQTILKSAFPNAVINIQDLMNDENHYSITIKDKSFNNLTKIAQHRLVNEALKKELLSEELHAMQLKTTADQ